ncbi:SDR family NAD(P)-dependent oxidoreductase [Novosphingobium piscinae]|uniref:SDR family oxidoreductase n=1 Tax=Novosphingobium piscinae TaxID=1507448 RepID=A0A7X1FV36_9SPHN|nr:SDR family oxidoreductase [Novosphingobium piscinae]MBC2667521.1 SDR family oxidoreductase [Novosphingobium piscinae]
MSTLAGRTVLVTGAGGGIGAGIAAACAEAGASLILADLEGDLAAEVAAGLPAAARARAFTLDVRSLASWHALRAAIGEVPDVLCNNAGVSNGFKPLLAVPPEEFERLMAVNVTGVYHGIATFAPGMVARGSGHIVNTASVNALSPFGSFAAYSASKFAVLGLSDALREELAPAGVGVSTLFPGLTRSRMAERDAARAVANDPAHMQRVRANMMDPLWVGRAVVRAIAEGAPYIVTHPEYRAALEARHAAILAAFGEPAEPGYRSGASATRPAD